MLWLSATVWRYQPCEKDAERYPTCIGGPTHAAGYTDLIGNRPLPLELVGRYELVGRFELVGSAPLLLSQSLLPTIY
jgi:hypothetical protein